MTPTDLTDAELDALLDGDLSLADGGTVAFLAALDRLGAEAPSVTPSTALHELMSGASGATLTANEGAVPIDRARRRRKMLAGTGAFIGTVAGKIALGTAVAAAAVGGAHLTDTIDVPGLPDSWHIPAFVDQPADQSPVVTAPGRDDVSPSDTAPGRDDVSPSDTAPGQTGSTPAVTAPGRDDVSPSDTAPGQTEDNPSDTAPGQTGTTPAATAPGRDDVSPSDTAPGRAQPPATPPTTGTGNPSKGKPNP